MEGRDGEKSCGKKEVGRPGEKEEEENVGKMIECKGKKKNRKMWK